MMENSSNVVTFENEDENNSIHCSMKSIASRGLQQQPLSTFESTKTKTTHSAQQRRPFQILNTNTSNTTGSFHSTGDSSISTKPILKMAKFQQYTKSDNVKASCLNDDVADEELSTISAQENKKEETFADASNIFRRRLDATDETMEQFWLIQHATPINEESDDDEELTTDE